MLGVLLTMHSLVPHIVGKSHRILVILSLEGELWVVGFAVLDWLTVWRDSARLDSAPKVWHGLIGLNCWNSSSVQNRKHKNRYQRWTPKKLELLKQVCLPCQEEEEEEEGLRPRLWWVRVSAAAAADEGQDSVAIAKVKGQRTRGLDVILLNGLADPLGMELLEL